jgi:hypothetical protein
MTSIGVKIIMKETVGTIKEIIKGIIAGIIAGIVRMMIIAISSTRCRKNFSRATADFRQGVRF